MTHPSLVACTQRPVPRGVRLIRRATVLRASGTWLGLGLGWGYQVGVGVGVGVGSLGQRHRVGEHLGGTNDQLLMTNY